MGAKCFKVRTAPGQRLRVEEADAVPCQQPPVAERMASRDDNTDAEIAAAEQQTQEEIHRVETRCERLAHRQEVEYQRAVRCKAGGNAEQAKHHLLIRRQCMRSIHRLQEVKTALVMSQLNAVTVGTMRSAIAVMAKRIQDVGDVDDVVDAAQDAADSVAHAGSALARVTTVDDADINDEFDRLVAELELPPMPPVPPEVMHTDAAWAAPGATASTVRRRKGYEILAK